jgi:hypothetical protein
MNRGTLRLSTSSNRLKPFLQTVLLAVTFALPSGEAVAKGDLTLGWQGGPSNGDASASYAFGFPMTSTSAIQVVPSADYIYYAAHQGGAKTNTNSPGASLGVQYAYDSDRLSFDVGPAIDVVWQDRKVGSGPKKNTTLESSTLAGPGANADLTYNFSEATSLDLSASYEQPDRYYWTRAGLEQRIAHAGSFSILLGPEVSLEGNNLFHQTGGGVVTEFAFDNSGTSLQLRGGYAGVSYSDSTNTTGAYVGVALDQRI